MKDLSWLTAQPVAHRGYHDLNHSIWENTLSAFARAVDNGFAIECDLQYTADSVPVVFHDDDMLRLCGIKGDIREKTAGELGLVAIGGTADKVPTLGQLLRLVKGRVPIILELKGRRSDDEGFADAVLETLESYDGPIALMSFDHWLLKDLKALNAPYPVGLTAGGINAEEFAVHEDAMQLGLDFVSYFYRDLPNSFITKQQSLGRPILTWTVSDQDAVERTCKYADQMTFEGFDPNERLSA
jgi:glycerophosphoryl diester phosphodiesterase